MISRAVVVGLPVEQQQARLRGDRDLDLVGQLQPAAALEVLLGQEDLDVPLEFPPVGLGEPAVVRDVPLDDREPPAGKGAARSRSRRRCLKKPNIRISSPRDRAQSTGRTGCECDTAARQRRPVRSGRAMNRQ